MNLRDHLKGAGISQREFAKRINTSLSALNRYVARTRVPPADVALRIIEESKGEVQLADLGGKPGRSGKSRCRKAR